MVSDISAYPNAVYKDKGWKGWGDWLGTGNTAPWMRDYRPFKKARSFARTLKLKGSSEWRLFSQGKLPNKGSLPKDIPSAPEWTYANKGWISWGDWLGTGNVSPTKKFWRSFADARAFARSLGLPSVYSWQAFCRGELGRRGKIPEDIPKNPAKVYAVKGWRGYSDWLGNGRSIQSRYKRSH